MRSLRSRALLPAAVPYETKAYSSAQHHVSLCQREGLSGLASTSGTRRLRVCLARPGSLLFVVRRPPDIPPPFPGRVIPLPVDKNRGDGKSNSRMRASWGRGSGGSFGLRGPGRPPLGARTYLSGLGGFRTYRSSSSSRQRTSISILSPRQIPDDHLGLRIFFIHFFSPFGNTTLSYLLSCFRVRR